MVSKPRKPLVRIKLKEFSDPKEIAIHTGMVVCRILESIHNATDPKAIELPDTFVKLEED